VVDRSQEKSDLSKKALTTLLLLSDALLRFPPSLLLPIHVRSRRSSLRRTEESLFRLLKDK